MVKFFHSFLARHCHATRRVLAAFALPLCISGIPTASAQDIEAISDQWLQGALSQVPSQHNNVALRMQVQVGKLDPRLNLAPCARIEPYLPSGSKLWGRTRIGLRCVEGSKPWNVFLPVTVQAFGPAWVLTDNISPGEVLTHEHAMSSEVDWAASPHAIIAPTDDWVGQTAARHLSAGQALRQTMVKAPQTIKANTTVKVLIAGGGFTITSSGKSLESAAVNDNIRVRMDNGRIVIGKANAQGDVMVSQ